MWLISSNGKTALMYAAEKGHTAIVELLVNEYAILDLETKYAWLFIISDEKSALTLANNDEIKTLLIKA